MAVRISAPLVNWSNSGCLLLRLADRLIASMRREAYPCTRDKICMRDFAMLRKTRLRVYPQVRKNLGNSGIFEASKFPQQIIFLYRAKLRRFERGSRLFAPIAIAGVAFAADPGALALFRSAEAPLIPRLLPPTTPPRAS